MLSLNLEIKVKCPFDKVIGHFNENLFKKLKPPFLHLEIKRFDGLNIGDEIHLTIGMKNNNYKWASVITENQILKNEWAFTDEGLTLPTPLKTWRHRHRIIKENDYSTIIRDEIKFGTKSKVQDALIYPIMTWQFAMRAPFYKTFFKQFSEKSD